MKVHFIECFHAMAEILVQQSNLEWQEKRQITRQSNRQLNEAVELLVEHAFSQGSHNAKWYYKAVSTCINKAVLRSDKSYRNFRNTGELAFLETAEYMAASIINAGIAKNAYYKDIYKALKNHMNNFSNVIHPPIDVDPMVEVLQIIHT